VRWRRTRYIGWGATGVTKAEGRVEAQPKLMRRAKRVYRKVKMKNLGNA